MSMLLASGDWDGLITVLSSVSRRTALTCTRFGDGNRPMSSIDDSPTAAREARMSQQTVHSRHGTISVRTTDRGLPVALRLDAVELEKPPEQLAHDIMALCRMSAAKAQVAQRFELAEQGVAPEVIHGLYLATEEDLARAEAEVLGEEDDPPASWMRSV
jgi:hypothetical protein